MYNRTGLQTARGSGTNGYVETNKFFTKPKTAKVVVDSRNQCTADIARKPNRDIMAHDQKRQIELKLAILEDKLMDHGYTDAKIVEKLQEARVTLEAASSEDGSNAASGTWKKV